MATKGKKSTSKKSTSGKKKTTGKKAPEEVKAEVGEPKKEEPAAEPASPIEPMADEVTAAPDSGKDTVPKESGTADPEATTQDITPEATTQVTESPEPAAVQVGPVRDPRIPPVGSTITRKFKGRKLEVKVLENGFEYEGEAFSSISALAKRITSHQAVNGYAFFKLGASAGGAGATRHVAKLANKVKKIETLAARLRAALAEGGIALADAEAEELQEGNQ